MKGSPFTHPSRCARSSGLGTCQGRPYGTAYGGASRPDLDRTQPLRCRALRSAGQALPTIGQPQTIGAHEMRTLTAIPARHTRRVRAGSAYPLHPALGIHDQPRPFPPLLDAKAASQLLGVPHTWLLAQARAGRIPHHRLGHYVRFNTEDLKTWLTENRIAPSPRTGHRF
jgi:excisionase family DNA binding protein